MYVSIYFLRYTISGLLIPEMSLRLDAEILLQRVEALLFGWPKQRRSSHGRCLWDSDEGCRWQEAHCQVPLPSLELRKNNRRRSGLRHSSSVSPGINRQHCLSETSCESWWGLEFQQDENGTVRMGVTVLTASMHYYVIPVFGEKYAQNI